MATYASHPAMGMFDELIPLGAPPAPMEDGGYTGYFDDLIPDAGKNAPDTDAQREATRPTTGRA